MRSRATGRPTFVFAHDTIVHDDRGEAFLPLRADLVAGRRGAPPSVEAHDFWQSDEGVTAVVAVGTAEQIHGASDEIDIARPARGRRSPRSRSAASPGMWGLIARAAGGTKGSALAFVAAHHGCTPEETSAWGTG